MLLLNTTAVFSQPQFATDRGSMTLGGSIYLSSLGGDAYKDNSGNRTFEFGINPDFTIFVVPSLAIGAEFNFSMYSETDYSNNSFGIGPEIVYYIAGHNDQKLYPYIGLSYFFSASSYKNTASDISGDSKNSRTVIKAGLLVMLSKSVALNTQFNYRSNVFGLGDNPTSGNGIYLGVGIKAFIFNPD